eukprot:Seg1345.18 transcript_id=Seg1345.18/GoldUCD/mRNA.D3Y31 product="hypothetical protein" protein_id=Seg1345.18/GoldUCD/D3Y31
MLKLKKENLDLRKRIIDLQGFINQLSDDQLSSNQQDLPISEHVGTQGNSDPQLNDNSWQKVESRMAKKAHKKQAGNKNTHNKPPPMKQPGKADTTPPNEKQVNTSKTRSNQKKCLLLGDSHVRRLDKAKRKNTTCAGIGGLMSQNLIQRHSSTINKEIGTSDEVIIHVGSNDIARNVPVKSIVDHVDTAGMKLLEKNPFINITISSILLEKYNPS